MPFISPQWRNYRPLQRKLDRPPPVSKRQTHWPRLCPHQASLFGPELCDSIKNRGGSMSDIQLAVGIHQRLKVEPRSLVDATKRYGDDKL